MKFDALIMAGGLGTRMCSNTTEKPMLRVGDDYTVMRVVRALKKSKHVSRILVSVSSNTKKTEKLLKSENIDTIATTGMDYMEDMHQAFEKLDSDFVITCPSDLPLLSADIVDSFVENFEKDMESSIAIVDSKIVSDLGVQPSFTIEIEDKLWVLSGLCISDRKKTLGGVYLKENYYRCDDPKLAVNVNTKEDLAIARKLFETR